MKLSIITENEWVVYPDTSEHHNSKKYGRIFNSSLHPTSNMAEKLLDIVHEYKLVSPITNPKEVKGYSLLITGTAYKMKGENQNKIYELGKEYGIEAIVTPELLIHPVFRKARFKEKFADMPYKIDISKENYKPHLVEYWPNIKEKENVCTK